MSTKAKSPKAPKGAKAAAPKAAFVVSTNGLVAVSDSYRKVQGEFVGASAGASAYSDDEVAALRDRLEEAEAARRASATSGFTSTSGPASASKRAPRPAVFFRISTFSGGLVSERMQVHEFERQHNCRILSLAAKRRKAVLEGRATCNTSLGVSIVLELVP